MQHRVLIFLMIGCLIGSALWAQSPQSTPELLSPIPDKDHGKWCSGDLLLDQEPNLIFSLWSESTCSDCPEFDAQVLADDFSVPNSSVVTEVVVWGWYFPNNAPPPLETWTLIFHHDASVDFGNIPGDVISSQTVTPVSRTATGRTAEINGVTVDEYRWLLRLTEPVAVQGGVGFFNWLEIYHDSPTANADTSIGFADLDPLRGSASFAVSDAAPGDIWSLNSEALALQICGVRSEWNGLMVPGYQIDIGTPEGPTTFLAVRNTADSATDIEVAYYGDDLDDGPLRVDPISLAARQTYTHDLRRNLSGLDPDNDGTASGFVVVSQAGGGASRLTGDVLRVDFSNDFATGERLLAFDDFCLRQEVRFVDFGSGSEFNVVLRDPPDSGAVMTVTALDEEGNLLTQVEIDDRSQVQRIPIEAVIPASFGSLVFDFSASQGGVVTASYSAFGRFSTELRGACRD